MVLGSELGEKGKNRRGRKKKNIGERGKPRDSLWRGKGGALFPSPGHRWVGKNVREALQGIVSQPILSLIVYLPGVMKTGLTNIL